MTQRKMMLPALRLEAHLEASTLDVESRTIEMRWYTGATIGRYDYFEGAYQLTFAMQPKSVRLGRLNNGAPFKAGHTGYSDLASVIGVVEKAWLENGEGRARVRMSARDDVKPILQDMKDGILKNVSMEAAIFKLDDVTEKGAAEKHYLATDWEPMAVALVQVGADPSAHTLSQEQAEKFPCLVQLTADEVGKETKMSDVTETKIEEPTPKVDLALGDKSEDRKLQDLIAEDTKRGKRIDELMVHFELDEVWAMRHKKLGSSVDIAAADARKRAAESAPSIDGRLSITEDYDSMGWKGARMEEALSARIGRSPCPEPARQFAALSIAEIAFECLKSRGETRGRALDPLRRPADVIKLAMSTSDFPSLLANVLNKNLESAYQQATPTFRAIASKRTFNDFRAHKFVRAGDFPVPLQVGENGEIQQGSVGEGSESVTAYTYGRILAIGRQTLINDDTNALQDFGGMVARRITDFENSTFYTICIAPSSGVGPALADALAVYHSTHTNTGSAGAMSNTLFGEAFGKMAAQTSMNGLKLNVPPKFVLTSPTSYITARTFMSQIYASQASAVNPFAGMLEVLYDANLSGTRFYVLADPAVGSNYVWGTIGGTGPRFEVRNGFEVEGVQVKVAHDFGCGAIDYRFGYTAAGA